MVVVQYGWRRCGRPMGAVPLSWADPRLGLVALTPAERADIIEGDLERDDVTVKILCDGCRPARRLRTRPRWH
ncbi:MAG: DUF2757 family protein [Actinomycetia bacterium]|nr:DUF2757 family protein [Actinomycetes bacterium]